MWRSSLIKIQGEKAKGFGGKRGKGEKEKRRRCKNIAIKLIPWKDSPKIMVTRAIPIIWWHRRLACAGVG
jgi:hypothetical protein